MRWLLPIAIPALLLQSFGRTVILVNFKINQAYIAYTYCENRDKPEMNCAGNCQLSKKMEQTNETEKQLPPNLNLRDLTLFTPLARQLKSGLSFAQQSKKDLAGVMGSPHRGFIEALFHPPDNYDQFSFFVA